MAEANAITQTAAAIARQLDDGSQFAERLAIVEAELRWLLSMNDMVIKSQLNAWLQNKLDAANAELEATRKNQKG